MMTDTTNDPFDPYPRQNQPLFADELYSEMSWDEFIALWEMDNVEFRENLERLAKASEVAQ